MRRAGAGLLLLLLILSTLLSCGKQSRSYDEAEVLAAARDLLPTAEKLNEIYYGDGIRPDTERTKERQGVYYPARDEDLAHYGIGSVDELKERTRATFSSAYASLLFSTKLSSVSDGENLLALSRFYQRYEGEGDQKTPTLWMVNSEERGLLVDMLTYDYDSLLVDGAEGEVVYVTLPVTAENSAGEKATIPLRIGLIEETNGWRVDTPTYARYPVGLTGA